MVSIDSELKEDYSNDSDIEESDSDNSFDDDFNGIGLTLPSFWKTTSDSNLESLKNIATARRKQLSNFIDDLKSGFSLQSSLDRFQTIRTLLESQIDETIQNNVDTSEDENNYEPKVIKPATEPKEVPILLDQVIIPQSKEPNHIKKKKKKLRAKKNTDSEVEELTLVSKDDMNNEALLRKRIIKIRKLPISEEEKNRLVQKLMMGTYYNNIKFVDDNGDEVFRISTDNVDESDGELDEEDETDDDDEEEEENIQVAEDLSEQPVIIHDEDKVATYYDDDETIMGCQHYQRNCKMECSKCSKWYCCPICHDEEITTHKMKRELTKHIMCMNCFNSQEPSEFCEFCDIRFAFYYCSKCKLYDNDDTKDIYHCDDCGICRLGLGLGQDFFHCNGCNACLSIELQDDHRCIERATQSDCPICGEFMFTSTKPVVFMSCGHAIHQSCYEDHSKHSYKCPTCHKTILNMEAQFRVLDREISLQPLPEPYCQWTCIIQCNDCNAKSSCSYHVLGLKCDNCKSYNTFQKKLIKPEESDYESDISSNNNNKKSSRDLRNISILNSNRLNTNYLVNEELNNNLSSSSIKLNELNNNQIESKTLTLPQQFLNNIDEYLANINYETSSEEEESNDEVDFLNLNKTLKHIKNNEIENTNENSNFFTNAIRDFLKPTTNETNEET